MAHYYFDTEDGEPLADDVGVELKNLCAARSEAAHFMGDLIRDRGGELWATGFLRVVVKDGWRRPLFAIEARVEPGPTESFTLDA